MRRRNEVKQRKQGNSREKAGEGQENQGSPWCKALICALMRGAVVYRVLCCFCPSAGPEHSSAWLQPSVSSPSQELPAWAPSRLPALPPPVPQIPASWIPAMQVGVFLANYESEIWSRSKPNTVIPPPTHTQENSNQNQSAFCWLLTITRSPETVFFWHPASRITSDPSQSCGASVEWTKAKAAMGKRPLFQKKKFKWCHSPP